MVIANVFFSSSRSIEFFFYDSPVTRRGYAALEPSRATDTMEAENAQAGAEAHEDLGASHGGVSERSYARSRAVLSLLALSCCFLSILLCFNQSSLDLIIGLLGGSDDDRVVELLMLYLSDTERIDKRLLEFSVARIGQHRALYSPAAWARARPDLFRRYVRFSVDQFDLLHSEIERELGDNRDSPWFEGGVADGEHRSRKRRRRASKFSTRDRLFLFLTQLRGNQHYLDLMMMVGCWDAANINRDFHHVCRILTRHVLLGAAGVEPEIRWPNAEERRQLRGKLWPAVPSAIAAIDGTEQLVRRNHEKGEQLFYSGKKEAVSLGRVLDKV